MYISTFMPLQAALSGVEAAQQELQTTANNITNANTPGYQAETVTLAESSPLSLALGGNGLQLGTGVTATGVSQAASPYLDAAYRTQNAAASNASTTQTYLNQVQSALAEPSSTGISAQLQTFWSDWNSLAQNPTSTAARQTVVNDGTTLAQSINTLSATLSTISAQATSQLGTLTGPGGQLENDASQIAQLNQAIQQAKQGGQNPNQLIDQRNQVLDDLSSLGKTTVTQNANGTVTVGFGDAAAPLVSGNSVNWPQTITSATGGTLGALLNLSQPGGPLDQYHSQLDAFAATLAGAVNNPVVNGSSVAMNPPFFSGTTASTLAVAVTPSQVQTTDTGTAGDNDVATAVAALSGGAPDQAYTSFVTKIGSDTLLAHTTATTQQALKVASGNQRQSVEGVDLSVQMTNLIQQQQAYQASAKVMNAFSTMMDSLMQAVA
jgi:flagellar hook-associated protein 1 FlgK